MPISANDLLAAMQTPGKRFDGVSFIAGANLPAYLPPFTQASFEIPAEALAATTTALAQSPPPDPPETWDALWFEYFSDQAHAALLVHHGLAPPPVESWPILPVSVLVEALAKAALVADSLPTPEGAVERQRLRAGLQITRVRIVADQTGDCLRLTNVRWPFSLRLLCCVIETPIALSNAQLVTLDLSGSAFPGVDASFITAAGSIRLRRSLVLAAADFAGAHVRGYFDASDAIIKPFAHMPANQSFDGDRGILNLSQATIDNEVTLVRTTVWGGLSMRGLHTKRSLFLDEASVLAPMSVLEAMARWQALTPFVPGLAMPRMPCRPYHSQRYAWHMRLAARSAAALGLRAFLARDRAGWEASTLHKLLTDTMRVRTTAVRGDGATIGGSLFAHALCADGRVRMKYARIAGGVSLQGARLRSIEAVRRTFDDLEPHLDAGGAPTRLVSLCQLANYRVETYNDLVGPVLRASDQIAPGADDYALDIREAHFGGSIRLGSSDTAVDITFVDGRIGCNRSHFDGELLCQRIAFTWTARVTINASDRLRVRGSRVIYDGLVAATQDLHDEQVRTGDAFNVDLRNAFVKDNVHFDSSSGLAGLSVANATIGGDLALCGDWRPVAAPVGVITPPRAVITIPDAARRVTGRIAMAGAEIGGDCRLLFDRVSGPGIDAPYAVVKGAWSILPVPPAADGSCAMTAAAHRARHSDVKKEWRELERAAFGAQASPAAWDARMSTQRRAFQPIDLSNARAAVFCHPPPAWPALGMLEVVGFRYRTAHDLGPLAPHPFANGTADAINAQPRYLGEHRVLRALIGLAGIAAALAAWCGAAAPIVPEEVAGSVRIAGGLLLAIASAYASLPLLVAPWHDQSKPMATAWLRLQRVGVNRIRSRESLWSRLIQYGLLVPPGWMRYGNIYHALEPYTVAVAALREQGRWISANLVERRRLEVRAGQLSWRLHLFVKGYYKLVNLLSGFGFSPVRLVFANATLVVVAAGIASMASKANLLVPVANAGDTVCQVALATAPDRRAALAAAKCTPAGAATDFPALTYGLDVVMPAFGIDETKKWTFKPPVAGATPRPVVVSAESLLTVAHMLGLLLFSVLIAAITARLSSVVNRFND